ncbi:L,D-transpeptidase family protein [Oryzibacter oryziterrae]|uniref:L,D-transpeptidase family protein n=1 Tax=Oryzibacter oryziterrae TaxID=2766474 RepID=UPI001F1CD6C7|nr:murein L,D-transpeptidase family protein [Oryzibacter oryziterrae]
MPVSSKLQDSVGTRPLSAVKSAIRPLLSRIARIGAAVTVAALLAACQADEMGYGYGPKDQRPVSRSTQAQMDKLNMSSSSPVLMRIFKEENTFEVWKMDKTGRYALLKSYQICKWSGKLGPKVKEGDRQAPEGFYPISPGLMNPNSDWYLAFNTGFPNAYDRANGRTGTALMVHGSCSSRGCYAMTDPQIQEIYALARDAFKGGQKYFQLQAFPFRLTAENMGKHWDDPNMPFWKMLKEGYDTFELTHQEPKVDVCGRKYVFNANPAQPLNTIEACPADLGQPPALLASLQAKAKADEAKAVTLFAELEEKRKADEEHKIQIAQAAEEAKRKAEERRLAAERNPGVLNSLFASAADPDAGIAVGPVIVPATGAPIPATDPRGSALHAMALAEPDAPQQQSSTFSRLFSFGFGDDTPAQPVVQPVATAPIVQAPAVGTPTVMAPVTAKAGKPAPALPGVAAPQVMAAQQPQPACAPPGAIAAPGTPFCAVSVPAAPPPQENKGLLGHIAGWF